MPHEIQVLNQDSGELVAQKARILSLVFGAPTPRNHRTEVTANPGISGALDDVVTVLVSRLLQFDALREE